MIAPNDAARIRALGVARRRAEAQLAALAPEVRRQADQLASIAEGIAVEVLQPKVLEGKLRRIANSLLATIKGQ